MSARNPRTLAAKTHRWQETQRELEIKTCPVCNTIVEDGDGCIFCGEGFEPEVLISMQYAAAQQWQAEQINSESNEYWEATR
jgi:hypothetical protein